MTLPALPPRPLEGHKGTFGRVLIVAGSRNMAGAAVLAGRAALRAGAGLVQVACPASIQTIVALGNPCYTTLPLSEDRAGRIDEVALPQIVLAAEEADVVVLGPGLGQSADVTVVVRHVLAQVVKPIVLDADGLNAIVGQTTCLRQRPADTILTPHPGEFARMIDRTTTTVQAERALQAKQFATLYPVTLVLKGAGTIVTQAERQYTNTTGNPGMATGGTGDVLAGVIGALVGQGLSAFDASVLGVYVHGRAGDNAANKLGQVGMTAVDVIEALPLAFRSLPTNPSPAPGAH
jgi:NAD(P)H-hydrate epimerase